MCEIQSNVKNELVSCFEFMNLKLENKVLRKCEDLCEKYNIEPEELCNVWCAYAASTMCTDAPTLEKLELVERKELQKLTKEKSFPKTPKSERNDNINKEFTRDHPTEEQIHETAKNIKNNFQVKLEECDAVLEDDNFLDEFMDSQMNSAQNATKYADRTNALKLKLLVGKDEDIPVDTTNKLFISQICEQKFPADTRHMYEVLGQNRTCRNSMAHYIGSSIAKKNNITLSNDDTNRNQIGSIVTFGRILKEGEGQFNTQSILLEDISTGSTVHLNIDKIRDTALFPGQIVLVKGKMLSGDKLIAENVYTDAMCDPSPEPPINEDPIRIIAAAGPYTLDENLGYDPMRDLLNYVSTKEPHFLILMGPFVDENHPDLLKMETTFDDFFQDLIKCMSEALQETQIQIVIVSSMRDVSHFKVYPTPPYNLKEKYDNVEYFPDPCILKIEDLLLGITSTDILYHIAKEEVVKSRNTETLTRLPSHIIQQRCFYPLYPPSPEMNVSYQFLEQHGMLESMPHMLLFPSKFKGFAKNIQGCVVVNPERLTKGNSGGAFADITILPGDTPIAERLICKILNI